MAENSKRAGALRKKQLLVLGGVGALIFIVSIGASIWLQPAPKHNVQAEQPKTRQLNLGGSSTDKEAWRMQSSAELDKMAKRLQQLEQRDREREDQIKREEAERLIREAQKGASQSAPVAPPPEPPGAAKGMFSQAGSQGVPPPVKPGQASAPVNGAQMDAPMGPRIRSIAIEDTVRSDQGSIKSDMVNSARLFGEQEARRRGEKNGVYSPDGKDRFSDDDPLAYNRAGGRNADTYLPAGTFVQAILLNGLDAPTGGQAQQNPHPVLLRMDDDAQLPNNVKSALKGCVMTANGHGDLSSERALIRLDRLSCVDEAGGAIDVAIRGYVSGEDGKTGLRGKLISKAGQVIANALLVGTLSGFGEAVRQGAVTTNNTAYGTQNQTVNNPLEYGVGTGVGKAMDRVAQYYIKLAEKLFPVVEISSGRKVDVVLTRGVSIERK